MEMKHPYHISSKSHLRAILAFLFLLVGFLLWYAARIDYQNTFERTRKELQYTALSLEERVKRTITATELILNHIAERIEAKGVEAYSSSKEEWDRFRVYTATLPDKGSLWLLDKTGDCLLGSPEFPVKRVNFSEREYFKPQRDQGIINYVGPVVKGRIVQKYSFTISRRINGKDGSFQGIVLAAIDTDDFTNFLRNISMSENAAVSVWRTDATLILRQPMEDRYLNQKYENLTLFKAPLSERSSGTYLANGAMDGKKRLIGYKKPDDMPLVVAASVPVDDIKQQWLGRLENYSLIAACALVGLLCLSWLVHKSILKEEKTRLELIENQKQLKQYNDRLQESNQALQDFASVASHDMQEPLRKVSAFGNMLKRQYGDAIGEEGKNYLDRMLNATERMHSLLTSLLTYSRVTTKAEPFRPVDLGVIVREVLSDLEVRIKNTGGEIHIGELPAVEADPTQMRQLFQNLIGNGLKFHKQGEKPVVKVDCYRDGSESCKIIVEDNGIGFDEKYLDRIFAPFQRLHGRSGQYEGTGMGLAICRKIIERHGGSITAESTPGRGSTFTITFSPAGPPVTSYPQS